MQCNELAICLALLVTMAALQPVADAGTLEYKQIQRGMTYVWWHDAYLTKGSDRLLEALAETGAN